MKIIPTKYCPGRSVKLEPIGVLGGIYGVKLHMVARGVLGYVNAFGR